MTASAAKVGGAGGGGSEATQAGGVTSVPKATPQSYNVGVSSAAERPPGSTGSSKPKSPRLSSPVRALNAASRCPRCTKPVDPGVPFCGYCGSRVMAAGAGNCHECGANYLQGVDLFCSRCGTRVGQRVSVEVLSGATPVEPVPTQGTQGMVAARRDTQPRLALLDDEGAISKIFVLERGEAVVGRGDADIRFEADPYMSPLHARVELRAGQLWLRDLGSRNGTWMFVDQPTRLSDGDLLLIGSQILRFRRLGYPGPHPPEADSTRRLGSLVPAADIAILEQLRADGSVRDTLHLSPGRSVAVGRETGDWIFPYDQTMSGRHAEVRSEDSEYYIHDAGSRNGVAMSVRGERALRRGQRLLLGNEILRVESA